MIGGLAVVAVLLHVFLCDWRISGFSAERCIIGFSKRYTFVDSDYVGASYRWGLAADVNVDVGVATLAGCILPVILIGTALFVHFGERGKAPAPG